MPVTPYRSYRYPKGSDPVAVPADIAAGLLRVDADVQTAMDRLGSLSVSDVLDLRTELDQLESSVANAKGEPGPPGKQGPPGPASGTEVTAPQLASMIDTDPQVRAALDRTYRTTYSPAEFGVVGDGVADDTAAWNRALATVPDGAEFVCTGTYLIQGKVSMQKPVTISGGAWLANYVGSVLSVEADDVTLEGLTIVADSSAVSSSMKLIHAFGTADDRIARTRIRDCAITGSRYAAVWLEQVTDPEVSGCTITSPQYVGIMLLSAKGGLVHGNRVSGILMGGALTNAYGIAVSDMTNDVAGRSDGVVIDSNYVDGAAHWEGIDTHSGINIRITNNTVVNARTGIAVVPGNSSRAVSPENVVVIGNHVIRGVGDDDKAGVQMVGISNGPYVTGVVSGNTITGYTQDLIVAYQDSARLVVTPQSTDATARVSPSVDVRTPWTAITMLGSFTAQAGNEPMVRRVGSRIECRGAVMSTGMAVSATSSFGRLPDGFAPDRWKYQAAGSSWGGAIAYCAVASTGVIQIRTGSVLATYYTLDGVWWPVD